MKLGVSGEGVWG